MTVKIVTTDGISAQSSTNTGFFDLPAKSPECQILFAKGNGGSASTPSQTHSYSPGSRIPIFAFPDSGFAFSKWTANTTQIVFDEPNSASTWATINGNGTTIATFTQIKYIVTINMGQSGARAPLRNTNIHLRKTSFTNHFSSKRLHLRNLDDNGASCHRQPKLRLDNRYHKRSRYFICFFHPKQVFSRIHQQWSRHNKPNWNPHLRPRSTSNHKCIPRYGLGLHFLFLDNHRLNNHT
jgi:hypothetical protein